MNTASKLLLAFLLCASPAIAQNVRYDAVAQTPSGVANGLAFVPAATITVCTSAGSGSPCTPKVSGLCTSASDTTCAGANPTTADNFGNYGFWIQPGTYVVSVTKAGLTGVNQTLTLACQLGSSCVLTGSATIPLLNTLIYTIDGVKYSGCPSVITAATGVTTGDEAVIPGTGPIINCTIPLTFAENVTLDNWDKTRDWCNGVTGTGSPPCFAINHNYDDTNVYSGIKIEMTTSHQDSNGASLPLYVIGTLSGATANGNSGLDGFSAEAHSAGTLSGTFRGMSATESPSTIGSTGGTITEVNGILGYVNVAAGATTVSTNVNGVHGKGCNSVGAGGTAPTNCSGGFFDEQTVGGTRNYAVSMGGRSLVRWGNIQTAGIDFEDSGHTTHNALYETGGAPAGIMNLQAVGTGGVSLCDNGAACRFNVNTTGISIISSTLNFTNALISTTIPTIAAAGCGGSAASIVIANGTAAFKVNVGTTPGSACTLTFPAATTGWNVTCVDITTNSTSVFLQKQTGAESTTSVTITNFNDVAVATAFVASDILKCSAFAD